LNDIIIPPSGRRSRSSYAQAMLIQFCFFTAYAIVSMPRGAWSSALGYKSGIINGLLTAALGACCSIRPRGCGLTTCCRAIESACMLSGPRSRRPDRTARTPAPPSAADDDPALVANALDQAPAGIETMA